MNRVAAVLLALFSFVISGQTAAPDAKWLKQIGGPKYDVAFSTAVDRMDNCYVTGFTSGTNISLTGEAFTLSGDLYLAKFDRFGSNLWVSTDGKGGAQGRGVGVDLNGNVYVAGTFVNPGTNTFGNTNIVSSSSNLFLAKYNQSGNFLWVRQARGSIEPGNFLTIAGNSIYLAGVCQHSVDFGSLILTNAALFLAVYDLDGNVVEARTLARSDSSYGSVGQIVVSTNGDYYASLQFSANILFGGTNVNRAGAVDAVLVKWNAAGFMQWFQHFRADFAVDCRSLALTPNNDVVVVGSTRGGGTIAGQPVEDAFIARFAPDGNLRWVRNVATNTAVDGVAVDSRGNSWICGAIDPGATQIGGITMTNVLTGVAPFVAQFDAAGDLNWSLCGGVATHKEGYFFSIALAPSGAAYLSGFAAAPWITLGSKTTTALGKWDILLARLTPEPPPLSISKLGNSVLLSWPTNQHGFTLEQVSVYGGAWNAVTNPVTQEDANFVVTNAAGASSGFFRLREQ
jgi:hypothetical protein